MYQINPRFEEVLTAGQTNNLTINFYPVDCKMRLYHKNLYNKNNGKKSSTYEPIAKILPVKVAHNTVGTYCQKITFYR